MELLYLSHCVPTSPDKGEKIRSHHELLYLLRTHSVHLVCFARSEAEAKSARQLSDRCRSVYVELLSAKTALAGAAIRYAFGACLTTSFYGSRRMKHYVRDLASRVPLAASIAYSSAMGPYAPEGIPLLLDMVDVDSEKWRQYASSRAFGLLYGIEARRLNEVEIQLAKRARCTFLATQQELEVFRRSVGDVPAAAMENGVDLEYFDPEKARCDATLQGRRFLAFVGAMDYYPNSDGACRFAATVFARLREIDPHLEFFIVGRNPSRPVRSLSKTPGITVTGTVSDVRPYLAAAQMVVAPLRIARGIQNKVLEALAMGKFVLASRAVCNTFGQNLPEGILPCDTDEDFVKSYQQICKIDGRAPNAGIRSETCRRFSWSRNLALLDAKLYSNDKQPWLRSGRS
jgi:sugar transferase (PEP-CTERM/EpsH1 system associated)